MRALYSLLSRARTVCALTQAMATLARSGWGALAPIQLLVLVCGLCILIAALIPSAPPSGRRRAIVMDQLCSALAAVAVIGLAVADAVGSCVLLGRLALGV